MRRTHVSTSVVSFVLVLASSAAAQDLPARLTLQDALQLARTQNPAFAAAGNEVEIAEADRIQATRRLNPAVSTSSEGYPLFDGGPRPSFFSGQELTIRIDQEFELAGRRRLRTASADAGVDVARSFLGDERRRLELAVQRAYLQVVLAKADQEVAKDALEDIDRVLAITKARLSQGEISGGEFRRLQVERLRFVDDQFATNLAFRNAKAALLAIMGFADLTRDFDVEGSLNEPPTAFAAAGLPPSATTLDRAALEQQALAARPDLLAARNELQRVDSESRLQRALRTPNVTFGAGFKRTLTSNGIVFGVTVPVPLFNRNPGGIARSEAERRRATNRTTAAETEVRLDVQQAVNALEVNQARVRYIEEATLTAAREARDAVSAAYQVGETGLIDFLDAQRSFRETLRIYNRALFERRISDFEVAAAIGRPFVPR
jgi:cobalt-zinc-cadmium efflux system outer membrane protein